MNSQNKTFEESMQRLEQIVRAMERGDVALEESLKLFQEGTELVRSCNRLLDEAHVVCVPGSAFGACGEGFIRICYTASTENIRKAMERIKKFCATL